MNRAALLGLALAAAAAGCAHLQTGAIAARPSAAPSASASPSPAPCGTAAPTALAVAMASYVTATTDPVYGLISGYALIAVDGTYSNVAQPIVVRPNDTLQFVNVEPAPLTAQPAVNHSAVGLPSGSFSSPPNFPAGATNPIGAAISPGAWSTGRVPVVSATTLCYSPPLAVPASGTFWFGDLDYYTSSNMRDVIVVSPSASR